MRQAHYLPTGQEASSSDTGLGSLLARAMERCRGPGFHLGPSDVPPSIGAQPSLRSAGISQGLCSVSTASPAISSARLFSRTPSLGCQVWGYF